MQEREGYFSPEAFEPRSYDEVIENILLDNENGGTTWDGLLAELYKKFWEPSGADFKSVMTPQRLEKIDSALRNVGGLKLGTPSMGFPDLWYSKKTHGDTVLDKAMSKVANLGQEDVYDRFAS